MQEPASLDLDAGTRRQRLLLSTVLIVGVNLIPVAGVLFWDWDVFYLLLLFWCENVIIGAFGILRLLASGGRLFHGLFFSVHYGGFMFGHLMLLFAVFGGMSDNGGGRVDEAEYIRESILDRRMLIPIAALFFSHAWSFVTNFLMTDERERLSGMQAMALPYKRMVVTHVALLVGGLLLTKTGQPLVGLVLLTGMKIALDVMFHRQEHKVLQDL